MSQMITYCTVPNLNGNAIIATKQEGCLSYWSDYAENAKCYSLIVNQKISNKSADD